MSAIDVINAHYAASSRGDLQAMVASFAEDISWTEMTGSPYAGTYTGPQQVVEEVFRRIAGEWSDFTVTVEHLYEAGEVVVAIGNYTAVYRKTGKALDARVTHVWRVMNNEAVSFEQFTDTSLFDRAIR